MAQPVQYFSPLRSSFPCSLCELETDPKSVYFPKNLKFWIFQRWSRLPGRTDWERGAIATPLLYDDVYDGIHMCAECQFNQGENGYNKSLFCADYRESVIYHGSISEASKRPTAEFARNWFNPVHGMRRNLRPWSSSRPITTLNRLEAEFKANSKHLIHRPRIRDDANRGLLEFRFSGSSHSSRCAKTSFTKRSIGHIRNALLPRITAPTLICNWFLFAIGSN